MNIEELPVFKKRKPFQTLHLFTCYSYKHFSLVLNLPFHLMKEELPEINFLSNELTARNKKNCKVITIPFNLRKQIDYSNIIANITNCHFTGILLCPCIKYFTPLFRFCDNLLNLPPHIFQIISKRPNLPRVHWKAIIVEE